ncbi:sporulation-delaying protein SdpB family protein [Streptomyces sp. NPDC050619]|uniref:sporulation-delaying protein SdpB family protein n=1 Tax=Streptomyces sp. NPDC050619 TaxID=3157214 RepID=UPI003422FFDA
MLTRLPLPWTNVYGASRSLLALGTAATLAFSNSATLFRPVAYSGDNPSCEGVEAGGAFCQVSAGHLDWMRWACVVMLLVAASGWRPRLTALPHAYVSFSAFTGIAITDGGDQLTTVLSLLLAVPALGDRRRWHWGHPEPDAHTRPGWVLAGVSALVVVRLQMSFVYFQAVVSKLPHAEWADGTGMWYWGNSLAFGVPGWLHTLVGPVLANPVGVAALTWAPLFVEISLAATLLLPQRVRFFTLTAGVIFHFSIAVMMGLWSFAMAMWAGLLLLCMPLGATLQLRPSRSGDDADAEDAPTRAAQPARTKATVSASDNPAS